MTFTRCKTGDVICENQENFKGIKVTVIKKLTVKIMRILQKVREEHESTNN